MSVLDALVSIIAPHDCLVCGAEGALVCEYCAQDYAPRVPSRCFRCNKQTRDYKTCESCRRATGLYAVVVCTSYRDFAKELIQKLKFERARAASEQIARDMSSQIPSSYQSHVLVPVPTASSRRRQRGYDQAELLAKYISRNTGSELSGLLRRSGQHRQVGTKRQKRLEQLQQVFWAKETDVFNRQIMLVDDVVTTGATLEAAAKTLKAAGAKRVCAVVFAKA